MRQNRKASWRSQGSCPPGDVVFLCVGLDPTMEGEEGNDTTDGFGDKQRLGLSDPQKELCDAVFSIGNTGDSSCYRRKLYRY